MIRGRFGLIALLMLTVSSLATVVSAAALQPPGGKVILTVSGKISHTNAGDKALFDRAMLEALGTARLELETPWTDGKQVFEGVPAKDLLDAVGARGQAITARAINDYQIDIPLSDFVDYPVIFALKHNGSYMRVRDKGPIWIVYPRETYPELDTDEITDRWVWQLKDIIIK